MEDIMASNEESIAAQRFKLLAEKDFAPQNSPSAELRVASALEYIAFQMGQINRKLDEVVHALRVSSPD